MREFYESIGFRCENDEAYFMVLVRDEFGEDLIQPGQGQIQQNLSQKAT